jgi:predicted RNA-binding Zn-ribbon protein involved in translation (DUF1610 family)
VSAARKGQAWGALAVCCPQCPVPAMVAPSEVQVRRAALAAYRCPQCGHEWTATWARCRAEATC